MNEPKWKEIETMIAGSRDALVCSLDDNGFPNAKAMFINAREGMKVFWFSTNVSAERTHLLLKRPQVCIYIYDPERIHGLMLTGRMEVLRDNETKAAHWKEGDERYYPLGPTDPDYCMLRFTAEKGNYWSMGKYTFDVTDIHS
jgi:general stress protein 26